MKQTITILAILCLVCATAWAGTMREAHIPQDNQGNPIPDALYATGYVDTYALSGSAHQDVTVPALPAGVVKGTRIVGYFIQQDGVDVYYDFHGGNATTGGADVTDGTGVEINPGPRVFDPADTFTMNCTNATNVSIRFEYIK